jgi:hypothetical protein
MENFQNEDFRDFYWSSNLIGLIKSSRMRGAGYDMYGENRNS